MDQIVDNFLPANVKKVICIGCDSETNKKAKDIKSYMQLNSYIVYEEIRKGIETNKNRRAIKFNIEKQLSDIQERIDSKVSIEDILQERIGA